MATTKDKMFRAQFEQIEGSIGVLHSSGIRC
jgi:hypothetical protein